MFNIYKEKIPNTDKRLNRHINHDERSKAFAFNTTGLVIKDTEHGRLIPILDQGQIGSCTGNAGIGAINTEPCVISSFPVYSGDETGALKLYSDAEKIDGGTGYPSEDVGSSGLSIAQALYNNKVISAYQHTFTLEDALKALTQYPIITGINWYEDMFTPDADGRVHPTGALAGGHEIEGYKIDTENGRIWFYNSWGANWGVNGTFYLTWEDYSTLLGQKGDVTVLIPTINTPPTPMNLVSIKRNPSDQKETIGILSVVKNGISFLCHTLELAWLNNQQNISCIPTGTYQVKWMITSHFPHGVYQIQNVPNRTGIDIHIGNYYSQLLGCIALGMKLADINKDGEIDVTSSTIAVNTFNSLMNKEDFTLMIA